jgi:hypothetical protein
VVTLKLFLFVLALVLLLLAALKVPEPRWLSFGWAGVFLLALSRVVWK